jgi:hypothetical protein
MANTQQDFEGMIRYKASPGNYIYVKDKSDNKDSIDINIWFTRGKILIRNAYKNPAKEVLVLIDSGKVYTINRDKETYFVDKLLVRKPSAPAEVQHIAGYRSSPVQNFKGYIFGASGKTTMWFADSLFFTVPEKYEDNVELLMVGNGHIMLKAEINSAFLPENDSESEGETGNEMADQKITIIASAVIPGGIKPEDFIIPGNFKRFDPSMEKMVAADSFYIMDTSVAPVAPPTAPKAPATPKKPAAKGKPTTKPPIRKEN